LVTGVVVYAVAEHVLGVPQPFLTSVASALLVYAIGAAFEGRHALDAPDAAS
jgi:hypothetical protein